MGPSTPNHDSSIPPLPMWNVHFLLKVTSGFSLEAGPAVHATLVHSRYPVELGHMQGQQDGHWPHLLHSQWGLASSQ